jgi:hypothetical protein
MSQLSNPPSSRDAEHSHYFEVNVKVSTDGNGGNAYVEHIDWLESYQSSFDGIGNELYDAGRQGHDEMPRSVRAALAYIDSMVSDDGLDLSFIGPTITGVDGYRMQPFITSLGKVGYIITHPETRQSRTIVLSTANSGPSNGGMSFIVADRYELNALADDRGSDSFLAISAKEMFLDDPIFAGTPGKQDVPTPPTQPTPAPGTRVPWASY